jgi:hypothetical protein
MLWKQQNARNSIIKRCKEALGLKIYLNEEFDPGSG